MSNQTVGGDHMRTIRDRAHATLERWLISEDGAGMAEYALLLLLVAFAAISIFTSLAGAIQNAITTWVSAFNGIN